MVLSGLPLTRTLADAGSWLILTCELYNWSFGGKQEDAVRNGGR